MNLRFVPTVEPSETYPHLAMLRINHGTGPLHDRQALEQIVERAKAHDELVEALRMIAYRGITAQSKALTEVGQIASAALAKVRS
jgi:hypothetical protein